MSQRVIKIFINPGNGAPFDVQEGDRCCNGLSWDEMLGQVAHLTHPKINESRFEMLTAEQWAERRRAHEKRMAEIAASSSDPRN